MSTEVIERKETMTSLEVASVCGKPHSDILKAIRKMEPAWEKVAQGKFSLGSYKDANGQDRPCYNLTKRETLFVATKFKDEERARLILRWEELEMERQKPNQLSELEILVMSAQNLLEQSKRLDKVEQRLNQMEQERTENGKLLLEVRLSDNTVPDMTLRDKVRQLVNRYTASTNTDQRDVWHKIYEELYYKYRISIRSYKKRNNRQTNLDIAEEHNFLQQMYDIISNMVRNLHP